MRDDSKQSIRERVLHRLCRGGFILWTCDRGRCSRLHSGNPSGWRKAAGRREYSQRGSRRRRSHGVRPRPLPLTDVLALVPVCLQHECGNPRGNSPLLQRWLDVTLPMPGLCAAAAVGLSGVIDTPRSSLNWDQNRRCRLRPGPDPPGRCLPRRTRRCRSMTRGRLCCRRIPPPPFRWIR